LALLNLSQTREQICLSKGGKFKSKCLSRKKCGFTEILALLNLSQTREQIVSQRGASSKNIF